MIKEEIEVIKKIASILMTIKMNDKTPDYSYDGRSKRCLNRLGDKPAKGERWQTPYEIADSMLKELQKM